MRETFVSKSQQLVDVLRTAIEEGRYRSGDRIEPERELAARWGVARLTAAKALDELARQGLVERLPSRGTFVTECPAGVPTAGHDRTAGDTASPPRSPIQRVGFCFLDVYEPTHPYFARLTRALAECCAASDSELGIFTVQPGDLYYRRPRPLTRALFDGRIDGLLVAGRMKIEDVFALERSGVPFVWINHEISGADVPAVLVDYAWSAFQATGHLVGLGHRRIALIVGTRRNRASRLTSVGFRLAMEAADVPPSDDLLGHGRFDSETGHACALDFLKSDDPPTAVLAADDIIAGGVLNAAHELGLAVPADLSLVGCGNFFTPHDTAVALTTSDINLEEVARRAVELLRRLAPTRAASVDDVLVKPHLIIRDSTAPPGGVSS